MSLKDYEWVPQWADGRFWSLHKKDGEKIACRGVKGYVGYVCRKASNKPGGEDQENHATMREAAKRVESWVKS